MLCKMAACPTLQDRKNRQAAALHLIISRMIAEDYYYDKLY